MSSSESSSASGSSLAPSGKRKETDTSRSSANDSEEESDKEVLQSQSPEKTVLSHAERRRQKKRQKRDQLADTDSQTPAYKKCKLDDGTAAAVTKTAADDPRRQKRQNSVWVGNLSYGTTEEALRRFFDGVGAITRVHMPTRRSAQVQNENMGFAYVDFETSDAKVIAITLSEGTLDGRNLLIKDGGDFTGRPSKTQPAEGGDENPEKNAKEKSLSKTGQKILRVQKQPPAPTLFLGNLGFGATEASIRQLFEAHRYRKDKDRTRGTGEDEGGEGDAAQSKDVWIRKIRMGTFEDSGNCKGFAFVDFTSVEHATEALVNPRNHRLDGRDLVVEYASADAVRRGGGGARKEKGARDRKRKGDGGTGGSPQKGSIQQAPPHTKQRQPRRAEQADDTELADVEEIPAEATTTFRSSKPRQLDLAGRTTNRPQRRARPGAALAQAQRQSAAIQPGQGEKIVF